MTSIHLEPKCGAVARQILESLPEWFGVAASVDDYVRHVERTSAFVAREDAGTAIGFLSLAPQTEATTELLVMGVLKEHHRKGIGAQLLASAEASERERGIHYLSVKTLAPTHPDRRYEKTRNFYSANGLAPVEIFPTLWGPDNPCLLMIKSLKDEEQSNPDRST